jgi:hypothetical protein
MYENSTAIRNRLGGLARNAGLPEPAIGRFIDTVRAFQLDGLALIDALRRTGINDVDLFGISRIDQAPRRADSEVGDGRAHGRTVTWTVRLYVRTTRPIVSSFADGTEGPERALAAAIAFRDLHLRAPHHPRGPYHPKRPRPTP